MSLGRLTLIEWLVLAAIAGVLVVLLTGGRSFEHGSFQLHVRLQGQSSVAGQIRWGLIRRGQFEELVRDPEPDTITRWLSTLPQPGGSESHPVRFDIDGRQTWAGGWKYKTIYQFDTLLVEYTLPAGSRRYRGIPINRRQGQQHVAISVPAGPPEKKTLIAPASLESYLPELCFSRVTSLRSFAGHFVNHYSKSILISEIGVPSGRSLTCRWTCPWMPIWTLTSVVSMLSTSSLPPRTSSCV